jgi:hypothetical protein
MPCAPVSASVPPGIALPIPGFGLPSAPSLPSFNIPIPSGLPEDLLKLFNDLQMLIPPGTLKGVLPASYGRNVIDEILKLLDGFMPYLMSYTSLLAVIQLIICIIEIICAIPNPFKLISAIQRLFRVCLPPVLNLIPYFSTIIMIISLLLLLLALIEFLIAEILRLIELILRNIQVLERAAGMADTPSITAALNKLGLVICSFQNLLVLLALFEIIFDIIKRLLSIVTGAPPCSENNGNPQQCCTPDVCPSFIRNNTSITGSTGTFQYYNRVAVDANLISVLPNLPSAFGKLLGNTRNESWQLYDSSATIQNAFINITNAFDLPPGITAVFFPTDANYTASTPISQVPYTIDLRFFYNPATPWGRSDPLGARFIRVNSCIVQFAPTTNLDNFDNSTTTVPNGVLELVGGLAFEDDNTTPIMIDGAQGTLGSFIHLPDEVVLFNPQLSPTDGYRFSDVQYTLHISHPVLLSKALITLGCVPSVGFDRTFINTAFGTTNPALLNSIVANIPSPAGAQACIGSAISALQANVNTQSVADFQATTTACLDNFRAGIANSLTDLINLGFDPNQSTFTLTPATQFTTEGILVKVSLNDRNGLPLTANMPADIAAGLALNLKAQLTFGEISRFIYDGASFFTANITSATAGSGTLQMQYNHQQFVTITIPTNLSQTPSIANQVQNFVFVYSPVPSVVGTPEGDTRGEPVRDAGDVAREVE